MSIEYEVDKKILYIIPFLFTITTAFATMQELKITVDATGMSDYVEKNMTRGISIAARVNKKDYEFPLAAGQKQTFTLDFSDNRVKKDSLISFWLRVKRIDQEGYTDIRGRTLTEMTRNHIRIKVVDVAGDFPKFK